MATTTMVEARNLNMCDRIVSVDGDTYAPAAEIKTLDVSDRAQGWVWVLLVFAEPDIRGHFSRWYRLGIYEWIEVK